MIRFNGLEVLRDRDLSVHASGALFCDTDLECQKFVCPDPQSAGFN